MAKISLLPEANDLDGSELVPIVQGGATRQASFGGAVSNLAQPFVDQAKAASDQAADLVRGENVFVDVPLAAAEAQVADGVYFKLVDSPAGTADIRLRTGTGSTLIYTEITRSSLASNSAGKGSSLIGLRGGGTAQDVANLYNCPAADLSTRTIPAPILAFALTDRAGARVEQVAADAGALPASGLGKWHFADSGGRRWWITSDLTTRALGAVIDGATNDNAVCKELVDVAVPYFGRPGYFSSGRHFIKRETAADVFYPKSKSHIIFQPGAQLVGELNIGGTGYYLPFFAIVDKTAVTIEGTGGKQFIFTNRLTYGAGQDFPVADITGAVTDKRLGSALAVRSDCYAAGVAVFSSHNVTLIGLGCESVLGSAWEAGAAYCHGFISTSGNCNNFAYDNIDADDVVLGVAVQGGDYGFGGFVRTDRMSQDIGIPGHSRYDYRRVSRYGATIDWGTETGADLTRQISHSVSYSGVGRVTFGPIISQRRQGPLNIKNCIYGAIFENVYWNPTGLRAGATAEVLPEQGRIYFVTGANNAMIRILSAVLMCGSVDVVGIAGDAGPGSKIDALIVRDNAAASTYGFISPSGERQEWNLTFRQVNAAPVDPARAVMCNGNFVDSTLRIALQGFAGTAPKVQVQNGSSYITRCNFIIANRHDIASGARNPAFGDPSSIWVDAADDNARARNRMVYEDGTSPWYKDVPAGTTYSVVFPFPAGSALVDVTIQSDLWSSAIYFERMETFLVRSARPHNRSGAFSTTGTSLGGVTGLNNTVYSIALAPAGGNCTVSGAITGAAAQGAGSRIYWTRTNLSGPL